MSSARFSPLPPASSIDVVTPPSGSACDATCWRRKPGVCELAMLLAAASSRSWAALRPDKAIDEMVFMRTGVVGTGGRNLRASVVIVFALMADRRDDHRPLVDDF